MSTEFLKKGGLLGVTVIRVVKSYVARSSPRNMMSTSTWPYSSSMPVIAIVLGQRLNQWLIFVDKMLPIVFIMSLISFLQLLFKL